MVIAISADRCISCGACAVVCRSGAIHLSEGIASVNHAQCTGCLLCINKCYMRAIHIDGNRPSLRSGTPL